MSCFCEFDDSDPDEAPGESFHYLRVCEECEGYWHSLHCKHDGHQTPCAKCGHVHKPVSIDL